jgi:hypothetical protein
LEESKKACKKQGYVWWDAGWRIRFDRFVFPITGYIWTTIDQAVTQETSIETGSRMVRQPDKVPAKQVEADWIDLGLPYSTDDPLHRYLRNELETLTLLKLSKIEELIPQRELDDFTLWDGRPVSQPPQGVYYINLP